MLFGMLFRGPLSLKRNRDLQQWIPLSQSRRQRSTDGGATEVMKGGDYVAQSKNK